jgi:hypothetical protein
MGIDVTQPMTPALYSLAKVYAWRVIDEKWDQVKDLLKQEEVAYRVAAWLADTRTAFGNGSPESAITLAIWKWLAGKEGTLDPFESIAVERITDLYQDIVLLLEPPPPPLPSHSAAVDRWRTAFEISIQRLHDDLKRWINAEAGRRQRGH